MEGQEVKRWGKSEYALTRRPTTRKSGFSSHPEYTGGEFKLHYEQTYLFDNNNPIELIFNIPKTEPATWIGFGLWFSYINDDMQYEIQGITNKITKTIFPHPNWSKIGSMWQTKDGEAFNIRIIFKTTTKNEIAIFEPACGAIAHEDLRKTRVKALSKCHNVSPESLILLDPEGKVTKKTDNIKTDNYIILPLKACNRCGRFLPVNFSIYDHTADERKQLSFTNHCTAPHKIPCQHGNFGTLRNIETKELAKLVYGFQLECRYCKLIYVNAPLNIQRTQGQKKEDSNRRRLLELLVSELEEETPHYRYRRITGKDLPTDIYHKFNGKCFNCEEPLPENEWHLDHTRPLSLLWPLDEYATPLCPRCNGEKRNRMPINYYSESKLKELSQKTGLSLQELVKPYPNTELIEKLIQNRNWLYFDFLAKHAGRRFNEGKLQSENILSALNKVIKYHPNPKIRKINLLQEYRELMS